MQWLEPSNSNTTATSKITQQSSPQNQNKQQTSSYQSISCSQPIYSSRLSLWPPLFRPARYATAFSRRAARQLSLPATLLPDSPLAPCSQPVRQPPSSDATRPSGLVRPAVPQLHFCPHLERRHPRMCSQLDLDATRLGLTRQMKLHSLTGHVLWLRMRHME
jgi:hypothetical protein